MKRKILLGAALATAIGVCGVKYCAPKREFTDAIAYPPIHFEINLVRNEPQIERVDDFEEQIFFYKRQQIHVYRSRGEVNLNGRIPTKVVWAEERFLAYPWRKAAYNVSDNHLYVITGEKPETPEDELNIKNQAMHLDQIVKKL